MATFSLWDWIVLIVMLFISAGIGIYYRFTGGKQKTTKEYFLADGDVSILPVSISLMASFMSAISLLGLSMEIYTFGLAFIFINISYIFGTAIASYLYLPVFFKLQATSAYEYLEKRFGKTTRLCASLAYTFQMVLYMGIVLYAPALALETVTNISQTNAILIIGLVCTLYSTVGGMKAVLFTDVFQSLLMFAAIYSIIICTIVRAGGISPIWETARAGGRIEFPIFDIDPTIRHTWFSVVIGGCFTYLTLYAVNQTQVQRLLTVRSLKASQRAMILNCPILSLLSLSTAFCGLSLYYFYAKCDPLLDRRIQSRDQIMVLFVVDAMGNIPGLPGIFVSGIFSASLSTISAAMNSLAAVTLEDYIKPLYLCLNKKPMQESHSTTLSKITACIYGFVCIGIAFLAKFWGSILQTSFTIFGIIGGPLFGLFSLGMFVPRANQRGAVIGLVSAIVLLLFVGFGPKPAPQTLTFSTEGCPINGTINNPKVIMLLVRNATESNTKNQYLWLNTISYLWYAPLGFCISFFGGWIFSEILNCCNLDGESKIYLDANKQIINADLFSPPIARRLRLKNAKYLENGLNIGNGDINDFNTRL